MKHQNNFFVFALANRGRGWGGNGRGRSNRIRRRRRRRTGWGLTTWVREIGRSAAAESDFCESEDGRLCHGECSCEGRGLLDCDSDTSEQLAKVERLTGTRRADNDRIEPVYFTRISGQTIHKVVHQSSALHLISLVLCFVFCYLRRAQKQFWKRGSCSACCCWGRWKRFSYFFVLGRSPLDAALLFNGRRKRSRFDANNRN